MCLQAITKGVDCPRPRRGGRRWRVRGRHGRCRSRGRGRSFRGRRGRRVCGRHRSFRRLYSRGLRSGGFDRADLRRRRRRFADLADFCCRRGRGRGGFCRRRANGLGNGGQSLYYWPRCVCWSGRVDNDSPDSKAEGSKQENAQQDNQNGGQGSRKPRMARRYFRHGLYLVRSQVTFGDKHWPGAQQTHAPGQWGIPSLFFSDTFG